MDATEDFEFSPLLEAEVEKVMMREKRPSTENEQESEMMAPRIAQLKDELEKKDKVIAKLKKDNYALKVKFSVVAMDYVTICS